MRLTLTLAKGGKTKSDTGMVTLTSWIALKLESSEEVSCAFLSPWNTFEMLY